MNIPFADAFIRSFVNVSNIQDAPYNANFEEFGLSSVVFVVLYEDKLLIWTGLIIGLLSVLLLGKLWEEKNHM